MKSVVCLLLAVSLSAFAGEGDSSKSVEPSKPVSQAVNPVSAKLSTAVKVAAVGVATLAPTAAWAIRVLFNGGGYAEMQFLTALSQLRELTELCFNNADICQLTYVEKRLVATLLKGDALNTKGAEVELHSDLRYGGAWSAFEAGSSKRISIYSPDLYIESAMPRPYYEIAQIAFQVWLARTSLVTSDEVVTLGAKIFGEVEVDSHRISLPDKIELHAANISVPSRSWKRAIVSLKNENNQLNLNNVILDELDCGNQGRLLSTSSWHNDRGALVGSLNWRCEDRFYQGRLVIQGTVDAHSIQIVQRSEIGNCDGLLIER